MAEYIERDTALEILHEIGGCGALPGTWEDGYDNAIDEAYSQIESEPAADVARVVHGRWVYGCQCSVCGDRHGPYNTRHKPYYNYCPNCGAKMDEEETHE